MTFLSDNPAIISLASDKRFSSYFKKFQFISLTNFGTAFGMGLLVMVFMIGQGFFWQPLVGFFGAFCGCIVSTRLMQYFVLKNYPITLRRMWWRIRRRWKGGRRRMRNPDLSGYSIPVDGGRTGVGCRTGHYPRGADHFHAGDGAHLRPLIVGRVYRRGL